MIDHIAGSREPLDHDTSRSICDAIGERLQRDLGPKSRALPARLQRLLDELRRRELADRRV